MTTPLPMPSSLFYKTLEENEGSFSKCEGVEQISEDLIWAEIERNRLVVVNPFTEIVLLYFSMQGHFCSG
jgi:hypothetical protein